MAPLYDVRGILPKIYPKVFKIYISATPRLHDFYYSPHYLKVNNSKMEIATINLAKLKPTSPAAQISTNEEPPFLLKKSCTYEGEKKEITLVNMAQERNFSKEPAVLSTYLKKQIVNSLKKGKWAVIIASHKNFANFIACKECGFIPSCPHCGKYLNIRFKALFHCNFCCKNLPTLDSCPKCSGNNFVLLNFGVESIKEKLVELKKKIDFKLIIPPDPVSGSRYLYSFWKELIAYQHKPVILLGLSGLLSLAKFLKKNIAFAASTSFDNILFHSDYRCEEKAAILYYNLLKVTEKVIIQTRNPIQPFFQKVLAKPYSALFSDWIQERKDYNYPPFSDLIKLNIAASSPYHQKTILENLRRKLSLKREVLEALTILPKVTPGKNKFIVSVLLKLRRGTEAHKLLSEIYSEFGRIKADPDPETLI